MRLFLLLLPVVISFSYCRIEPETDATQRWMLLESIIRKFVGNQASISIFDIDNTDILSRRKSVLHRIINAITPVYVYKGLNESLARKITDMGDELEVPSTSKSYVVMSASTNLVARKLKCFASINTNGKWIFTLVLVDSADVDALLIKAWNEFKMANIFVIFSDIQSNLFVKSFNPFRLRENQHGTFFNEAVNMETLSKILRKVDGIYDKKVRNLQNYPLKATMFKETSDQNEILDMEMKKIFEKILNTNFTIFQPSDYKYHGTRLPNGTFTGEIEALKTPR